MAGALAALGSGGGAGSGPLLASAVAQAQIAEQQVNLGARSPLMLAVERA
eukprot:COSAG04_NODE_10963_length_740_cov_1.940718_2_plen_49_part_01